MVLLNQEIMRVSVFDTVTQGQSQHDYLVAQFSIKNLSKT